MKNSQVEYMMENAVAFYGVGYEMMEKFRELEEIGTQTECTYLTVAATNVHFAVEIALKALSELTISGFNPRTDRHDLLALFLKLSDQRQKDIIREYDDNLNFSKEPNKPYGLSASAKKHKIKSALDDYKSDLHSMLEKHKNGFEQWRYHYYGIDSAVLFFDYEALAALFQVLQIQVGFIQLSLEKKS